MFAAQIIADDTFTFLVLIAAILFVVAAVMAVLERAFVIGLIAAGLAFLAFAWFVVS